MERKGKPATVFDVKERILRGKKNHEGPSES